MPPVGGYGTLARGSPLSQSLALQEEWLVGRVDPPAAGDRGEGADAPGRCQVSAGTWTVIGVGVALAALILPALAGIRLRMARLEGLIEGWCGIAPD